MSLEKGCAKLIYYARLLPIPSFQRVITPLKETARARRPGVWTKGRYIATRHRVRQTAGDFRTSIAFFYEPNFDAAPR